MRRLLLAALVCSSLSFAAELKPVQEEAKTAFDKQAKTFVDEVNADCGTRYAEIAADFENYDKKNYAQMPPAQACSQLTYAIKQVCKTPAYKKAVAAKVKGLSCQLGGDVATYEVKNGVFTMHMAAKEHANAIEAVKVLKAELDK